MSIPDYISERLETIFWIKILKFFDSNPDPGIFLTLDPGTGMEKIRSGIDIPDPQHWYQQVFYIRCRTGTSRTSTSLEKTK